MTLKASFTTIRYYTAADPYHYTIDNRPLTDLKTCLDFLADTMDAGITTALLTTTAITTASATALSISTSGGIQFKVANTASAINFGQIVGGATGAPVVWSAVGGDALVNVVHRATGATAFHRFDGGGVTFFDAIGVTSGVNYLSTTAAVTGQSPAISIGIGGSPDTNVNIRLLPRGTGSVLYPDGALATPAIAWTSDLSTGFFRSGGGTIEYSSAGTSQVLLGGGIALKSTAVFSWSSGVPSGTADLTLVRDAAADTLAQRRTTNAQISRIYKTFTDAANYERLAVDTAAVAGDVVIRTENAGTGVARRLMFGVAGGRHFGLDASGNWIAQTDNTSDIGQAGATRPRSGYFAGRLLDGQITVTYSASMTLDASLGNDYIISATNATAFTINAPTNPLTGQFISIIIRNTSGGALGVATWNATFKMTAWTQPANANSRCIYFAYDGTNWVERGRTTADVPN